MFTNCCFYLNYNLDFIFYLNVGPTFIIISFFVKRNGTIASIGFYGAI